MYRNLAILGPGLGVILTLTCWSSVATADADDGHIEIGGGLGVVTGGGSSAGGLNMGGNLLYRLDQIDWFEGNLSVTLGGSNPACFTDRQGDKVCTHGPVDGRMGEITAGIRRYLLPKEHFMPYVKLQVGVRFISFPDDGVNGIAIPIHLGAGVRARVTETISVGGGATLSLGAGWLNQQLGLEPQASLSVGLGVEFRLD